MSIDTNRRWTRAIESIIENHFCFNSIVIYIVSCSLCPLQKKPTPRQRFNKLNHTRKILSGTRNLFVFVSVNKPEIQNLHETTSTMIIGA
jgi:hypothetical protein